MDKDLFDEGERQELNAGAVAIGILQALVEHNALPVWAKSWAVCALADCAQGREKQTRAINGEAA